MLLKEKCKMDIKLKLPILFKRFIGDGFGILEGNKLDFEHWITEIILRETITIDKFKFCNEVDFMDLFIQRGRILCVREVRYICFSKRGKQICVHPNQKWTSKHTIRNFILGKLRRYVRCSTQEFYFFKTNKKHFFQEITFQGIQKSFSDKTL